MPVKEGVVMISKISAPPPTMTMFTVVPEAAPAVNVAEPVQSGFTVYVPELVKPWEIPPLMASV